MFTSEMALEANFQANIGAIFGLKTLLNCHPALLARARGRPGTTQGQSEGAQDQEGALLQHRLPRDQSILKLLRAALRLRVRPPARSQGWQFNRRFVGMSFGPRISPNFGPSIKLKRSYVDTKCSNSYTGTLGAENNGPRIGPSFGPRFLKSIELPPSISWRKARTRGRKGRWKRRRFTGRSGEQGWEVPQKELSFLVGFIFSKYKVPP